MSLTFAALTCCLKNVYETSVRCGVLFGANSMTAAQLMPRTIAMSTHHGQLRNGLRGFSEGGDGTGVLVGGWLSDISVVSGRVRLCPDRSFSPRESQRSWGHGVRETG